jgi:S-adenosylmethionine:tRNA ribosyltransferase-isomerase
MMCKLSERGVRSAFVTLHVGAGTFLPVKVENVENHKMHSEWGEINNKTVDLIRETKLRGGRVIPVGTTSLRLIEAAAQKSGNIEAWSGDTDIFIYPGFDFKVADALMTNFHLPGSTLLMLVSAFVGQAKAREIYEHAIQEKYRFFSYGDASFLVP